MTTNILVTPVFFTPDDDGISLLREHGYNPILPQAGRLGGTALVHALDGVAGAIIGSEKMTADVLDQAPQLKVISRPGVGVDSIDIAAATKRGIAVCNIPGVNTTGVSELTLGLMNLCARRLMENYGDVEKGRWRRLEGTQLRDRTLGVVGLGSIGWAVARLAKAYGMTVIAYDVRQDAARAKQLGVEYVPLDRLLSRADYVSLHVGLNASTRELIDRTVLSQMKSSAILINTARGGIINEDDLADALKSGGIRAAALDSTTVEPLPEDSILRTTPNLYITPHIGGVTTEARQISRIQSVQNVIDVLSGKVSDLVVNAKMSAGS